MGRRNSTSVSSMNGVIALNAPICPNIPADFEFWIATFRAANTDAAMKNAVGRGHNDFKIDLAKRTLCRTLAHAAQEG